MDIGNLFKPKDNLPAPEYFLAIQIQEGIVKTAIWQVSEGIPTVTTYGTVEKWSDLDSLVIATDSSLSNALEGQTLEPDRVIFGLPDSWVKEDKINPEQTPLLKELIAKLELKPIGFVVITEAVTQQLKANEGIPPTAIFLELHQTKVNVVVVKLGETIGKEEVGRSGDLAKDVEEGLARLNIDQLPARMLVIDGDEPDLEQQLTSYSWQDQLPFLHLPKVEIPAPEFSIKAVAISGGSQAAKSLGIQIVKEEVKPAEESAEPLTEPAETPVEVTEEEIEPQSEPANEPEDLDGFVIGQDIRNLNDQEPGEVYEPETEPPQKKSFNPLASLPNIHNPFSNFQFSFAGVTKYKKPALLAIPVGVIALFLVATFVFSKTSKASITVYVEDKQIDKSFEIAIADTPQDLPTLPATTESIELESSATISTTGEALVGEKAKGEVNLFNKTDSPKTLDAGTILVTSNNLRFTLDEQVTIASQSSQIKSDGSGEETIYGQAKVKATASAIGAESNLDKDVEFSVGSFPKSSLLAKGTTNFSGGTSRTVKAVSKKDLETLKAQVKQDITTQAEQKLASPQEFQIVPQTTETIKEDYSAKSGEEAENLSLTLVAKATFLKFHHDRLNDLLKDQLKGDIPIGYVLGDKDSQISVDEPATNEDDLTTTNAHIKASLVPDLNLEDYQKKLKGKSVDSATTLLRNISGYKKVVFEISPRIPFFSKRPPGNESKISLKLEINP